MQGRWIGRRGECNRLVLHLTLELSCQRRRLLSGFGLIVVGCFWAGWFSGRGCGGLILWKLVDLWVSHDVVVGVFGVLGAGRWLGEVLVEVFVSLWDDQDGDGGDVLSVCVRGKMSGHVMAATCFAAGNAKE